MRQGLIIQFVDLLALTYHEARNVRHLPDHGGLSEESRARLISLATNKFGAWKQLGEIGRAAASCENAAGVIQLFQTRFRVSPSQLQVLYQHPDWRNANIGGHAWVDISAAVISLADVIDSGDELLAQDVLARVMQMRHNTGIVQDKLRLLEDHLSQ